MNTRSAASRNDGGSSLVESMVAFTLISGAAIAIFPIYTTVSKQTKYGNIRQLCERMVNHKLNEYLNGRPVNLSNEAAAAGDPRLARLSVTSFSNSTIAANQLTAGGFLYAKLRYNKYYPYACNGRVGPGNLLADGLVPNQPNLPTYPPLPASELQLGMRECIGSEVAWLEGPPPVSPDAGAGTCPNPLDARAGRELPGFKLYVKLQLESPWATVGPRQDAATIMEPHHPDPALPGNSGDDPAEHKDNQYSVFCPNNGSWARGAAKGTNNGNFAAVAAGLPGNALYDFDGADDAIRVTVTGVIDFRSINPNMDDFAGISDPRRLMCSATGVIEPFRYPVRYFVSQSGRIQTVHGRARNRAEAGNEEFVDDSWAFQTLYSSGGTRASNILSIAVHPRNYSIYALRSGSLMRYSNCGGVPLDCNITDEADGGISDNGTIPFPSVMEWPMLPSIRHIAVDFRNGRVYGVSGDKREFYLIDLPIGAAPTFTAINPGEFPRPRDSNAVLPTRVTGFFIAPGGGEAYVTDLATTEFLGSLSYTSTIYPAWDTTLTRPVIAMPLSAISYSK